MRLLAFFAASGVGVNPEMSSEFVRARKFLGAAFKSASMRLFACVRANVPCLVLETVKGSIAERTFVRARNLALVDSKVGG